MKNFVKRLQIFRRSARAMLALWLVLGLVLPAPPSSPAPALALQPSTLAADCQRTIMAKVVALDQTIVYNRLGVINPVGMIYALRKDVVNKTTNLTESEDGVLAPGEVKLRDDKRPRPLTLRMNVGDCLRIEFQNLLAPNPIDDQPATRNTGIHVDGMQLRNSIADDGSNVGQNPNAGANPGSLVALGNTITYTFYAEREGTNLLYSPVDTVSAESTGTWAFGLFGAVNVEPAGAEWYRSQVTWQEMEWAKSTVTPTTPDGQPIMNYDAVYPAGHRYAGLPILKMLNETPTENGIVREIVHSDLTAIITGPDRGWFKHSDGSDWYPSNPAYPDRNAPFREFTLVFHDEIKALQAFPIFEDPQFEFTLHSVRDSFAINYGTGGVGAEIVANRLGVGPMYDCVECKYEEFFLTSWVVGDPAMIVDKPANTTGEGGGLLLGPKATKALYPEDPSNVYHSYLNDNVKFRNIHAGKEHHLFHLHAHQWLATPDDDNSSYLDSQAVGPGSGYTYEIAYGGSGNRNKTPGDSIFHCHFYPHFAQGMWALWRVHDTFEAGTETETDLADGLPWPVAGSRALPDGEIARGTPIPGLVPIPALPMAPMPGAQVQIVTIEGQPGGQVDVTGTGNPGYPFFIPAIAGHRPPTPPKDIVDDGGLKRHVVTDGEAESWETPLNFAKDLLAATVKVLPEDGTDEEVAAMNFHSQRWWSTYTPSGAEAQFETNGLPPIAGAPYAEPCRTDNGAPLETGGFDTDNPRIYKGADIQLDMKINKAGWHTPQARILTLWEDVQATLNGTRAPEPFVMRANSGDCIKYYHTNLIPNVYEQDAFQVKTPTDVIGQHIHLVKFDVTSADGSANGFNYEDGTLSPDEVRERINAVRATNVCGTEDPRNGLDDCPVAKAHPYFGPGPGDKWLGARTTVQRWYADPVLNKAGQDRTLGNVYTHDHYGPSTHQQTGLYATLLIEPTGSQWRHPETGARLGDYQQRSDGGPASWHADIIAGVDGKDSFREFYFEYQDFMLAYEEGRGIDAEGKPIPDPAGAINPPGLKEVGLPDLMAKPDNCPNGQPFLPNGCPEAISAADVGTFSVNYRNEPVALRVRDPNANSQAADTPGDLSFAFSSKVSRKDTRFNSQPTFYPPLSNDVGDRDPYTPMMRVYDGDKVRIKLQVGATEEGHNSSIHGIKWLQEMASKNSGWRNSQMMGISEQFTFEVPITLDGSQAGVFADYLYMTSSAVDGLWNGSWGLMRAYKTVRNDLRTLPNNPIGPSGQRIKNANQFNGPCPKVAPTRPYTITAVLAAEALPEGTLVYNPRPVNGGPLHDPTAILYVRSDDLDVDGKLKPGVPVEPLILRAAAGDCIRVTLYNRLPAVAPDLDGFNAMPPIVDGFNANDVRPSSNVGLHPQLLTYDITKSDGANVGQNATQTVAPGNVLSPTTYLWYAGDVRLVNGNLVATPVEFGATNLISSDRIKHSSKGAIGVLIVEPQGATWVEDAGTRASATVTANGISFRDFVLLFQDDINMRLGNGSLAGNGAPLPFVGAEEDAEDSGAKALNYRTEPLWLRLGIPPEAMEEVVHTFDFTNALSNGLIGGDPVTPVFTAKAWEPIRFRVLQPGGHPRNQVFALHGHIWQRNPYTSLDTEIIGSTRIGNNPFTEWKGTQEGLGPTNHWDFIPEHGAGGKFGVTGDYLYRTMAPGNFYGGMWGIFRVETPTTAPGGADLALTKTDSPDPVQVGQNLTYQLVVSNGGPETASAVVLTDTLPAGVSFVSATPSHGTCGVTGPVTCSLGDLPGGNNATVTIVVNPTTRGNITNTATVASATSDSNPGNNTATATTEVKNTGKKPN